MATSSNSTEYESHQFTRISNGSYTVFMPIYMQSHQDNLENEINKILEHLKSTSGIVSGLLHLEKRERLQKVVKQCDKMRYRYLKKLSNLSLKPQGEMEIEQNKRKHTQLISDYLQKELRMSSSLRTESERYDGLGDTFAYFLVNNNDDEPQNDLIKIIYRLSYPLYNHTQQHHTWSEFFWQTTRFNKITFQKCLQQLSTNNVAFEYLLYQKPDVLFNTDSNLLLQSMVQNLPYANVHQILTNIRKVNKQTLLFVVEGLNVVNLLAGVYKDHGCDLYQLLKIQDLAGRTALHANTKCVAKLLTDTYTPRYRAAFQELASMRDNNYQTPKHSPYFSSLMSRVEENRYLTDTSDTNVLIIYNAETRQGARKEAQFLYRACRTKYDQDNIVVRKNLLKDETLELIKQMSHQPTSTGTLKALIVILASHGSNGRFHDSEGTPIQLSAIEEAMCSDQLKERPKVLITQCCQIENDDSTSTEPYVPQHDHFCAIMSCRAGQASERQVFLDNLSKQIIQSDHETDIFKIFNGVTKEMKRQGHMQNPIIMCNFRAQYCPTDNLAYGAPEENGYSGGHPYT